MDSLWPIPQHKINDLREFLAVLAERGDLREITTPVSPNLELTEISRRALFRTS